MKIIEDGRAPNPRRVRIFLAEKAIAMTYEQVDINTGGQNAPDIVALNPLRRFPILVLDDGSALSESVAICRYFEALQPEPALFGRTPLEQASIEMWNRRAELGLLAHVAGAFRHLHPAMAELEKPQVAPWGELCRDRIPDDLAFFDRRLGQARYLAGDAFSIADITLLCAFDFMRVTKVRCPEELVHLRRWHGEVSARPSAKA
ncbi:MAG: glutathione S-transferase [Rhizobiales bacterium]|nr:glutathione S-transferase [Hyphomicrobiales bacterium]